MGSEVSWILYRGIANSLRVALGTSKSLPDLGPASGNSCFQFFSKFKTFSPCFLLASEISKVEFGPSWGENFFFKVHLHLAYPEITFHFHFYPSEIWFKKKVLNMFGEE